MNSQEEDAIEEVDLPASLQLEIDSGLSSDHVVSQPNFPCQRLGTQQLNNVTNGDALSVSSSSLDSLNLLMEKQRMRQLNHPLHQEFINVPQGLGNVQNNVKETSEIFLKYDPISKRKVLNTYEIINELGHGQHGKVKLARDILTKQLVAIKIVDRHEKKGQKFFRIKKSNTLTQNDKIKREIAIMKKCHYKHVVKLIEVLDDLKSRKIYLVLEYCAKGEVKWCPGDQMETEARGPPLLSFQRTREILRGVVLGLEYLHYQGVIHRDIKPANLLISEDNTVKISDFGVSLAASGANSSDSSGESIDELELAKTAGTPAFFAPEICLGNEAFEKFNMNREDLFKGSSISFMIDIWALGVTLYCLLFGMLPFISDYELELFEKIVNDPVVFPEYGSVKKNGVSEVSCEEEYKMAIDIVNRLLEKNPLKRITISEIKKHPFVCWDFHHIQPVNEQYVNSKMDELKEFELSKEEQFKQISISKHELKNAVLGVGKKIKESVFNAIPLSKNPEKLHDSVNPVNSIETSSSHDRYSDSSLIISEGSIVSNLGKFDYNDNKNNDEYREKVNDFDNDTNDTTLFKRGFSMCNDNDNNDNYNETNEIKKELSQKEIFERELKNFDDRQDSKNIVDLPINSSFASLDSFYIDNYAMSRINSEANNAAFGDSKPTPSVFARPPHVGGPLQNFAPNRNNPVTGNFPRRSSSRLDFLNYGMQSTRNDRIPRNTRSFLQRSANLNGNNNTRNNDPHTKPIAPPIMPNKTDNESKPNKDFHVNAHNPASSFISSQSRINDKDYQIRRGNFFRNLNNEGKDISGSSEVTSSDESSYTSNSDSDSGHSAAESLPFEFAVESTNASVVSMRDLSGFEQVQPFIRGSTSERDSRQPSLSILQSFDSNSDTGSHSESDDSDELILTTRNGGLQRRHDSPYTTSSSAASSRRSTLPHLEVPRQVGINTSMSRFRPENQESASTLTFRNVNFEQSSRNFEQDGEETLAVPSAVMSSTNQANFLPPNTSRAYGNRPPQLISTFSKESDPSLFMMSKIRDKPTTYLDDVSGKGHHTDHLGNTSSNLLKTVLKSSVGDSGRRRSVPYLMGVSFTRETAPEKSKNEHVSTQALKENRPARALSRRDHTTEDPRSKSIAIASLRNNKT